MHMFRKKISDYLEKCGFLSHGYKLFAAALLVLGMAACSDDDNPVPEPDPEPTSTFKLHIGEGNIVPMDLGAPDNYHGGAGHGGFACRRENHLRG